MSGEVGTGRRFTGQALTRILMAHRECKAAEDACVRAAVAMEMAQHRRRAAMESYRSVVARHLPPGTLASVHNGRPVNVRVADPNAPCGNVRSTDAEGFDVFAHATGMRPPEEKRVADDDPRGTLWA